MSDKNLLIVGGSGFIGAHIANMAAQRGYNVTVSTFSGKKVSNPRMENIELNVLDSEQMKKALNGKKFQYVINCAGYIDHKNFTDGGKEVINQHLIGVFNLVECLDRDALKSFIQIGSSDEYGGNSAPQNENQREAPISPYSFAKSASSHFLEMLHRTENFPSTTLRIFLTYGPGQDARRFIPQIVRGCLKGETFSTSEGKQYRDFCYIDDAVEAILECLQNEKVRGKTLNLGSGKAVTIREMIEKIIEIIGRGEPEFGKYPYRKGENMALYADVSQIQSLLKWKPKINLEEGLRRTIQYYQDTLGGD